MYNTQIRIILSSNFICTLQSTGTTLTLTLTYSQSVSQYGETHNLGGRHASSW
jgi:hypothetical protein